MYYRSKRISRVSRLCLRHPKKMLLIISSLAFLIGFFCIPLRIMEETEFKSLETTAYTIYDKITSYTPLEPNKIVINQDSHGKAIHVFFDLSKQDKNISFLNKISSKAILSIDDLSGNVSIELTNSNLGMNLSIYPQEQEKKSPVLKQIAYKLYDIFSPIFFEQIQDLTLTQKNQKITISLTTSSFNTDIGGVTLINQNGKLTYQRSFLPGLRFNLMFGICFSLSSIVLFLIAYDSLKKKHKVSYQYLR